MSKPTLKQILDALKRQVLVGKSYLNVAKGLLAADPFILQGSETCRPGVDLTLEAGFCACLRFAGFFAFFAIGPHHLCFEGWL